MEEIIEEETRKQEERNKESAGSVGSTPTTLGRN
jgi:hypothetical protein